MVPADEIRGLINAFIDKHSGRQPATGLTDIVSPRHGNKDRHVKKARRPNIERVTNLHNLLAVLRFDSAEWLNKMTLMYEEVFQNNLRMREDLDHVNGKINSSTVRLKEKLSIEKNTVIGLNESIVDLLSSNQELVDLLSQMNKDVETLFRKHEVSKRVKVYRALRNLSDPSYDTIAEVKTQDEAATKLALDMATEISAQELIGASRLPQLPGKYSTPKEQRMSRAEKTRQTEPLGMRASRSSPDLQHVLPNANHYRAHFKLEDNDLFPDKSGVRKLAVLRL
jgi:hypothetical protein